MDLPKCVAASSHQNYGAEWAEIALVYRYRWIHLTQWGPTYI